MASGAPDGGARAYMVALASFLCNGIIFGVMNTFGVLYIALQPEINRTSHGNASSKAALVGSLALGTTFLFSLLAGILVDKMGIRPTAFIGGALATVGMFISAFSTSQVEVLYLTYGLLLGLGASLTYTPSLVILGHYFDKYMGIVNGFVCAGSSIFTIFMPFLLKYFLEVIGLKLTFICLSALMSLLMACALIFKPLHEPEPESLTTEKKKTFFSRTYNVDIWKEKRYIVWAVTIPFTLLGYYVPYVHAVKYVEVNFPDSNGSFIVLAIGISSGIGRIVFGRIADIPSVNRIALQQISFIMIGTLTMLLTAAPNFTVMIILVLGMGLFDGCFITLLGPIAYDLCGKSGAGQAIGTLLALCSVPLTIGPPIAGMLYDRTGSYLVPFLLSGIPPIVGGLVLSIVHCFPPSGSQTEMKNGKVCAAGDIAESEGLVENKKAVSINSSSNRQSGAMLA